MEFELIEFIKNKITTDSSVVIGIGDDAAVMEIPQHQQLVVSTDTLNYGVHFDEKLSPNDVGYKSLAVNLSDLAAMGAAPKWCTLNLSLPELKQKWIEGFVSGFLDLAEKTRINLVGGDTTAGALSATVTVFGLVDSDKYLQRSTARKGDLIAVSGELGSAAYALKNPDSQLIKHLQKPLPRLDISERIKGFASSCIDISDGLASDLNHICKKSRVGAKVNVEHLPVHHEVKKNPNWMSYALSGGDDYQLCFTFAPKHLSQLPADCTVIGEIKCGKQADFYSNNEKIESLQKGYIHFNKA